MYDVFKRCRGVLAMGFCVFLCAARLHAQSGDATLTGTVLDVAGKPIAMAAVSAMSESTGSVRQATTDTDGKFSVSGLPDGLYTIDVTPALANSALSPNHVLTLMPGRSVSLTVTFGNTPSL